jgi:haloacetate dehalogenase
VLALWGERGTVHRCFRPLDEWRRVCDGEVSGRPLASGHYLPEEVPDEVVEELLRFLEVAFHGDQVAARGCINGQTP